MFSSNPKKYGCHKPSEITRYHSNLKRHLLPFHEKLRQIETKTIHPAEKKALKDFIEITAGYLNGALPIFRDAIRNDFDDCFEELKQEHPSVNMDGFRLIIDWYKLQVVCIDKKMSSHPDVNDMGTPEPRCQAYKKLVDQYHQKLKPYTNQHDPSKETLTDLLAREKSLYLVKTEPLKTRYQLLEKKREQLIKEVKNYVNDVSFYQVQDSWDRMAKYESEPKIDVFYDEGFRRSAAEQRGFVFKAYEALLLHHRLLRSREKAIGDAKEIETIARSIREFREKLSSIQNSTGVAKALYTLLEKEVNADVFLLGLPLLHEKRVVLDRELNPMHEAYHALARDYVKNLAVKSPADIRAIDHTCFMQSLQAKKEMESYLLRLLPEPILVDFDAKNQQLNQAWRRFFETTLRLDENLVKSPLVALYQTLQKKNQLEERLGAEDPEIVAMLQEVYDHICATSRKSVQQDSMSNVASDSSSMVEHYLLQAKASAKSPRPISDEKIDLSLGLEVLSHHPQSELPPIRTLVLPPDIPWFTILGRGALMFLVVAVAMTGVGLFFELSLALSAVVASVVALMAFLCVCRLGYTTAAVSHEKNQDAENAPQHTVQGAKTMQHNHSKQPKPNNNSEYFSSLWQKEPTKEKTLSENNIQLVRGRDRL